jgi:hypothetical protein
VETLGVVSVFGNDWYGIPFGDRYDRWRSGHVRVSVLRGQRWDGALPAQPFELMEYRFRGEIIAPDNLSAPAPGDRLYAPSWWLGATTHFGWSGYDVAAGADLVMVGPQTGIEASTARSTSCSATIRSTCPPPTRSPMVSTSMPMPRSAATSRSASARRGPSWSCARGRDAGPGRRGLHHRHAGQDGLRLRDQVSGQRVAGLNGSETMGGWSFPVWGRHGLCRVFGLSARRPWSRPRGASPPPARGGQFRHRRQQLLLRRDLPVGGIRGSARGAGRGHDLGRYPVLTRPGDTVIRKSARGANQWLHRAIRIC